jgi:hypothetical protein
MEEERKNGPACQHAEQERDENRRHQA